MFLNSYVKPTKCGAIRNMTFFLLSWFFVFGAYGALELLQSSLNTKNGLGVYSISILYGMKALSSLFGPVIVTSLTPKWTLLIGYLCHTVFILCNFYPKWFTMIPASILLGLATGPLWICCGVYTTVLGVYYSDATGQSKDAALSKFNGIQGFVISLAVIVGNVVSSSVLKYVTFEDTDTSLLHAYVNGANQSGVINTFRHSNLTYDNIPQNLIASQFTDGFANLIEDATTPVPKNQTEEPIVPGSLCGTMYCPEDNFDDSSNSYNDNMPDERTVYILLCVLGLFNICGIVVILLGLQNIQTKDIMAKEDPKEKSTKCQKFVRYIKLFFNWKFILLIPSITYLFVVLAINNSTFMRAYVTCTVGIDMIGYIAMVTGISMAIMNYVSGLLGQCLHRNYLFALGFLAMLGVYGIMMLWDAFSHTYMLFIASALFGGAGGLNMSQFSVLGAIFTNTEVSSSFYGANCLYLYCLNTCVFFTLPAFLGAVFTNMKTEAFSFYQFISGAVMCVTFLLTNSLCVRYQIYVALAIMGAAMVTYSILSIHLYQKEREELDNIEYQEDFESNAAKEMDAMIRESLVTKSSPGQRAKLYARAFSMEEKGSKRKRAFSVPGAQIGNPKIVQFADVQRTHINASHHSISQL